MSVNNDVNFGIPIRSNLEIDQAISTLVEKIRATVQKRLWWGNVIIPYSKTLFWSVIKDPVNNFFKAGFCAGTAYIIYLLTRGTLAGIEVDSDSNFFNVFSSNKDVRLNEGLNLTNGDQAGQFMIDGLALGYIAFKLIFQDPYNKLAGEIINDCYKMHLIELLNSAQESDVEEGLEIPNYKLKKCTEEVNRLYKRLKEDLKHYGQEPIFYEKMVLDLPQETDQEISL